MFFIRELKSCFVQGENKKRYKVLRAITEAIKNEYPEDNYNSRISWFIEELLRSDPDFILTIRCMNDKDSLKQAVADAVETVWQGK